MIMGILKDKGRCTLCGSQITLPYRLDKYGIPGFVCSRCYDDKLREIYGIDLSSRIGQESRQQQHNQQR